MTRLLPPLLTLVALSLLTVPFAAAVDRTAGASFTDGVWINGTVDDLATGPPPANAKRPIKLYVIAPVSAAHPLHPLAYAKPLGFGAHDHVAGLKNPRAAYHGVCDLTLVVPGPKAKVGTNVLARHTLTPAAMKPLLYRARLDGTMAALNWASRIKQAQSQGLATLIDTKTVIACTMTPR